jgi:eukaryotic-like serine/threonine-protein kinase
LDFLYSHCIDNEQDTKKQLKFPKSLTSRKAIRFYIIASILVIFFFLGNDMLMPWYVNRGGKMPTPSVIGMRFEEAQRILDSMGLSPRQGDIRPDNKYPIGSVINQNPPPGKVVNSGRRVYLTISGGEKLVVIPNLKGRTIRDATFALERQGLKLGTIQYALSDEFPVNTVISQETPADMKARRETYVSVTVSQGKTAASIAVPDLNGKTLADADKILKGIGLVLGNVNYQPLPNFLPNTIIDQFPHIGEMVPAGQAIDVVVVKAGEKSGEKFEF